MEVQRRKKEWRRKGVFVDMGRTYTRRARKTRIQVLPVSNVQVSKRQTKEIRDLEVHEEGRKEGKSGIQENVHTRKAVVGA